jgi:hypothetical protein
MSGLGDRMILRAVATLTLIAAPASATTYTELKSAAVANCRAIDPDAAQSGLTFNPDGYRSYYLRSQCFQDAAVKFRDDAMCAQVKRRFALFSSSWGYSQGHCRELVIHAIDTDRKALEDVKRAYATSHVALRDFRIERNGNGRDFDIIPSFSGTTAGSYRLTLDIIPTTRNAAPIFLYSSGHHVDASSNLRLFVRQSELRQHFPDLALDRPYTVRATLTLDVGIANEGGYWSDAFVERIFPIRERSHSITREVRF